ncbi:MAG: hypothetical protein AAGD32_15365 [Planctomycetota bacterium]
MSNQERVTVVAILTNLLVNGYAVVRVGQLYADGALAGDEAVTVWARAVVWVIPAAIGLTILLNVLFAMADRERQNNNVIDERDRQFQLRGMGVTLVVVCLGYVAMLGGLAFGWATIVVLNVLFFSFAAGDLLGNAVRLASYRVEC